MFSDIFFFLIKSGCIDFVDFVDKLVVSLTDGDPHILRTNHVTWLLAQTIKIELVMNALTNARKVDRCSLMQKVLFLNFRSPVFRL